MLNNLNSSIFRGFIVVTTSHYPVSIVRNSKCVNKHVLSCTVKGRYFSTSSMLQDSSIKKGFIKLNGKKKLITESELEVLILEFKQKAQHTYNENKLSDSYLSMLRSFINGVFQVTNLYKIHNLNLIAS